MNCFCQFNKGRHCFDNVASLKWDQTKRREIVLRGANSDLSELTLIEKGGKNENAKVVSLEMYSFILIAYV